MVKKQDRKLENDPEKPQKNTRIITVSSGKGGVGKTNVSVNLGLALQQTGEKVLLLDADLGMANIDILLGLTARYNLKHVMMGNCSINDALLKGPDQINILPGTSGGDELIDLSRDEVKRLLRISSHLEDNYDIIIIDIGAGAHQGGLNFTLAADEALIVLTPEPTSIMDAYSLIKILSTYDFKGDLGLIINQVIDKTEGEEVAERMSGVIEKYLSINVKMRGFIPYDRKVIQAVKKQSPLFDLYPESKAATAFRDTANILLDRKKESSSTGMKSFLSSIVDMFRKE
jgi:flagellar biosynthesis protein FlhG